MNMKKLLWVSRHPMTEDQKAGLPMDLQGLEIVHVNQTWVATDEANVDIGRNLAIWSELANMAEVGSGEWTATGVFPPVALEALAEAANPWFDGDPRLERVILMTPVSRQAPELRASADAAIPFVHQRWAVLLG